ncbi:hypothetical protein [Methylocystis sp. S23]
MISSKIEIFWMVHGDGPTNVRHSCREIAEREAERLARNNPGHPFYVLRAVARYRRVEVERVDLEPTSVGLDGEPPF